MMDADPARFCATFTWNCETLGVEDQEAAKRNTNNNEHNTLGLLIDANSLLYHVAMEKDSIMYASPSTVHDSCQIHVHRLLRVVGKQGGVHLFFDGLPPREKFPSQVHRMTKQAIMGDKLARGDIEDQRSVKLLHHLAEWAFVEAVERLRQRFNNTLHIHRASIGEAEALINQWLIQNDGKYSRVAIVSEDSDFLVYDSCPGFIPPSTLVYEDRNGRHSLRGRYYLRTKFLRSFLEHPTTGDSTIMTTVAALAGCDYCTTWEQADVLESMRLRMIKSNLGGLRPKSRNNPSASDGLLAILRVVSHYKKYKGFSWLERMCQDFTVAEKATVALNGIQIVHGVYMYSLQMANDTEFDIVPGMVEVRRLLQYGVIYCHPIVETFTPTIQPDAMDINTSQSHLPVVRCHFRPASVNAHALIPCPPLSTQFEVWITRSSIWHFPHFRQIRARLYSYVRLLVYHGRAPSTIPPGDFWTLSTEPTVEEIIRMKSGKQCTVERTRVSIPEHYVMSTMLPAEVFLRDDIRAIDRALVFCLLGAPQQLKTICSLHERAFGTLFIATIMLPFNLAFLLIMMASAPREIANFDLPNHSFNGIECAELKKVLPILSVACAHANFLVNTIAAFWPDKAVHSYLVAPINISTTFRHDTALMIWNALRLGRNLEYLASSENFVADDVQNIATYIEHCFDQLKLLRPPEDEAWILLLKSWMEEVTPMFDAWWDVFNLEESDFPSIPDFI